MAVFTKAQAKKLSELDEYYMPLLDELKKENILTDKDHRRFMLTGYYRLIEFLQEKKLINAKQADDAMKDGYISLVDSLS